MNLKAPAFRFTVALLAALGVGLLTWRALARARLEQGVGGPATRVLVLRKSVTAGKAITAGDVEPRFIPAAFAEPGVYRDTKDLSGARARILLSKGEQLTRSKLESESSRLGLAWSIPPGMSALTLRLSAEGAVGGHVLPGDWVAVLGCPPRGVASEIVSRARVGAVQERIWDPAGAPGSPPAALGANEFFLVTLLLASEHVARVVTAGERGHLTLKLLSSLDEGVEARVRHAR